MSRSTTVDALSFTGASRLRAKYRRALVIVGERFSVSGDTVDGGGGGEKKLVRRCLNPIFVDSPRSEAGSEVVAAWRFPTSREIGACADRRSRALVCDAVAAFWSVRCGIFPFMGRLPATAELIRQPHSTHSNSVIVLCIGFIDTLTNFWVMIRLSGRHYVTITIKKATL